MLTHAVLTQETTSKEEMKALLRPEIIMRFQQELKRTNKEISEIETKSFNTTAKQEILEKFIQLAQGYEQIAVTDEKLGASLTSSLEIFINSFQKIKCLTNNHSEEAIIPILDALDSLFQKELAKVIHSSFNDQPGKLKTFFEKLFFNPRDKIEEAFNPQNNVERSVVIAITNRINQQCDVLSFISALDHIYSLLLLKSENNSLYLAGKTAYDRLFQIAIDLLAMDDSQNQYKIANHVETLKNLLKQVIFLLAPANEEPLDFRIELLKNISHRYFDPISLSIACPFEETELGFYHFNPLTVALSPINNEEINEDKTHLAVILRIANRLADLNKTNTYPYQELLRKLNQEFTATLPSKTTLVSSRKLSQPVSYTDAPILKDLKNDDAQFANILYILFPSKEFSFKSIPLDSGSCEQRSDKTSTTIVTRRPELNKARIELLDLFTEFYSLSQNKNFDAKTLHLLKLFFNEYTEVIKASKNPAELVPQMQAIKALYNHCYFGKNLTTAEIEATLAMITHSYLCRAKAYFMLKTRYPSDHVSLPINSFFDYLQKETAQAALVLNLATMHSIICTSPIWLPVKTHTYVQALINNFIKNSNADNKQERDKPNVANIETMIRRTHILTELEKLNLQRGSDKTNTPFLEYFSKFRTRKDSPKNMIYQGACEELSDLIATATPDVKREEGLLAVLSYVNGKTGSKPDDAIHYFKKYPAKKMLKCGFYALLGCALIGAAVTTYIMTSGTSAVASNSLIQIGCGILATAGVLDLILTAYFTFPSTLSKGLSLFRGSNLLNTQDKKSSHPQIKLK